MPIEKECLTCGKKFFVKPYYKNKAKFCSHPCYSKSLVGISSKKKTGKYIICKLCDKKFWIQPNEEKDGRKFCSSKCYHDSPSLNIGRKYVRKKIIEKSGIYIKCETCKKTFYTYPYQKDRRFCSMNCTKTGIYKKCKNCSKEFWAKKCHKDEKKFCCKKCADECSKTGEYNKCKICGKNFYVTKARLKNNGGKYCSIKCSAKVPSWNRGLHQSEKAKEKNRKAHVGKHLSIETRIKIGNASRGEKNYNWKNGVTSKNEIIRKSLDYKLWREAVFARDNYVCQKTQERGKKLHSHHIQNFSDFIELRFEVSNGITLSKQSHIEFHKIYGKQNNTREQLDKFINQ